MSENYFKLTADRLKRNSEALSSDRVVLFSHLGFGDQIAIAPALEAWSSRVEEVILLAAPSNIAKVSALYSYLPNLSFTELPSQTLEEAEEVARKLNGKLVEGGRGVLRAASACFPTFGLNRLLCIGLLCANSAMESPRLRRGILNRPQMSIPNEPYIFVDDRPGHTRRIPERVTSNLRNTGYRIVSNQGTVPLESQAALIDNARELHLVVSAPACLALAANLGKTERNLYSSRANFLKRDYSDWRHHLVFDGEKIRPAKAMDSSPLLASVNLRWSRYTRSLRRQWLRVAFA